MDEEIEVIVVEEQTTVVIDETGEIESVVLNVGPAGAAGADGGSWTDSGTRAAPNSVTTSIPVTSTELLRIFIKGSGGPVTNPTIANVSGNKQIKLFGTSDTDTVSIAKSTSNFELSGQWVARNGSILALEWDGSSKYTESFRNEI